MKGQHSSYMTICVRILFCYKTYEVISRIVSKKEDTIFIVFAVARGSAPLYESLSVMPSRHGLWPIAQIEGVGRRLGYEEGRI